MTQNYFTYQELLTIRGMTKEDIKRELEETKLVYLGKGLYVDFAYAYALKEADATYLFPDTVHCLLSALSLHELTLAIPNRYFLASRVDRKEYKNTDNKYQFIQMRGMDFNLGREVLFLNEEPVFVFDREKTICDILKFSEHLQEEHIEYAIMDYKRSNPQYEKLFKYGQILGVTDELNKLF